MEGIRRHFVRASNFCIFINTCQRAAGNALKLEATLQAQRNLRGVELGRRRFDALVAQLLRVSASKSLTRCMEEGTSVSKNVEQ